MAKRNCSFHIFPALVVLVVLLAVACGAAATATPVPKPTAQPAAPEAKPPEPAKPAAPTAPVAQPTPTAAPKVAASPTPVPAPVVAKAKVERLVIALSPPIYETNFPWGGTAAENPQFRPMMEALVEVDPATGELKPMLATKWEISADAKQWTFHLRGKVPFHFNFGEFTARDVVHSHFGITQTGSLASDAGAWRAIIDNFQVAADPQLVFNLKRPEPDLLYDVSARSGNLLMVSKAQWDAEGKEGMGRRPAGTGSYQFVERQLGRFVRFERVPYKHWRVTPEFKELEMRFVKEDATRLAMLLAEEAHIVELPRDLQKQALGRGMKVAPSSLPAFQVMFLLGGLYFATPDKLDAKSTPWVDRRVREALNRAVNRKEIIDVIFQGRAEPLRVFGFHPTLPGWNPEWEKLSEEMYGFDPIKAKVLLGQAGYPDGFPIKILLAAIPGTPEIIDISQAIGVFFSNIGLKVTLEEVEFARLRGLYRDKAMQGQAWTHSTLYRPPHATTRLFHSSGKEGVAFSYEHEVIDTNYAQFIKSAEPVPRDRLLQAVGNHKFNEYAEIPIAWVKTEVMINPKVVAEYVYPGIIFGAVTHLEYLKAGR